MADQFWLKGHKQYDTHKLHSQKSGCEYASSTTQVHVCGLEIVKLLYYSLESKFASKNSFDYSF